MGLNSDSLFDKIISLENLFLSWKEFKKGKTKKVDATQFEKTEISALSIVHPKQFLPKTRRLNSILRLIPSSIKWVIIKLMNLFKKRVPL